MSYGIWNKSKKERAPRQFFEKAFRRKDLAVWDAKWQTLSLEARSAFLKEVKGPHNSEVSFTTHPSVPADQFAPAVLTELVEKGFVEVAISKVKTKPHRVSAVAAIFDFATRVRSLHRFRMLDPAQLPHLAKYVEANAYMRDIPAILEDVLRKAGIQEYFLLEEILKRYVVQHRWPGRVTHVLKDKVAEAILTVLREADAPILLVELPDRIKAGDSVAVRAALDALIARLVVFEDLDPKSLDLIVGLLPVVRDEMALMARPRQRPALVACETPREVGPEGSLIVDDLRAFLLEVASEPPRLRQDLSLFAKETDRFIDALTPLSAAIVEAIGWRSAWRVNQSNAWARLLHLVKEATDGKQFSLRLTPKGDRWLASGLNDQYSQVFECLVPPDTVKTRYAPGSQFLYGLTGTHDFYDGGDIRFLGSAISAIKNRKQQRVVPWDAKPDDHAVLRTAIFQSISELPLGIFFAIDNVLAHLTYGSHNPLDLGTDREQVLVFRSSRAVPPIEEEREQAARELLEALIRSRLLPLGCFRAAIDPAGRLCVARSPLLEAYFGGKTAGINLPGVSEGESRVVVQPDFSVIIIGLNPAPAAALAPFCERSTRGGTQGAMILKLTRESVVRAVANGMKPAEIVDRLKSHADTEVPPNVLKEVENWAGWVRRVTTSSLTVLRCPDRDTADRVMSALKRQAERVTDTLVAIDLKKLASADRNKLRDHGIIVQSSIETETSSRSGKRRRGF